MAQRIASFSSAQARVLSAVLRPACTSCAAPLTPMKRSPSTGWSRMPSTGTPASSSAISEPHSCRPVMKARVPSTGSSTQRKLFLPAVSPNSSPRMASSGRSRAIRSRMARSAPRSASVTGSKAALPSLWETIDGLAEKRTDHRAAGIGQAVGEGDGFGINPHDALLAMKQAITTAPYFLARRILWCEHEAARSVRTYLSPADVLTTQKPSAL